jgi:hypothetical protein
VVDTRTHQATNVRRSTKSAAGKARYAAREFSWRRTKKWVERFGLASPDFLGHVQQEFLVVRFHFRK